MTFLHLFLVLCALNALDAWLTVKLLRSGADVREGNPLMRFFMRLLGRDGALLALKLGLLVLVWRYLPASLYWREVMLALCVFFGLVCVNNWQVGRSKGVW